QDGRRVGHVAGHPGRRRQFDRVRIADRQYYSCAIFSRLITDALDLQLFLVAVDDALDHVGDQATGKTVERPVRALVAGALAVERFAFGVVLDGDFLAKSRFEFSLGAFDAHGPVSDLDFHRGGIGYWLLADPGHG